MKIGVKQIVIVVLMIFPVTIALGQGKGQGLGGHGLGLRDGSGLERRIPDLTDDQKAKIEEIHLNMLKESQELRNKLGENRAKMNTLRTADDPDMKAIEKLIDESAALQAELWKEAAASHQEVRKVLTEEQRIIFDSGQGRNRRGMDRPGRGEFQGQNEHPRRYNRRGYGIE